MLKLAKEAVDIGIVVSDIDAQNNFYGTKLGLPKLGVVPLAGGTLHIYRCGNSLLKLYAMEGARKVGERPTFGTMTGISYLTLDVSRIEDVLTKAVRESTKIVTDISEFDAGVALPEPIGRVRARYAMLADAEGNLVELLERS